jgi:hypothetical protein
VHRYLHSASATIQLPVAEAMITYKEKRWAQVLPWAEVLAGFWRHILLWHYTVQPHTYYMLSFWGKWALPSG